jgi:hypothetical protein
MHAGAGEHASRAAASPVSGGRWRNAANLGENVGCLRLGEKCREKMLSFLIKRHIKSFPNFTLTQRNN